MPRKLSRKTRQQRTIKKFIRKGYSSRQIQKELRKQDLGLRRKTLLREIRVVKFSKTKIVKGKKVTIWKKPKSYEERAKKGVPIKYRKKVKVKRLKELDKIYRMSLIIRDIPLHSKPYARNYLGFRLNCFALTKEELINAKRGLKLRLEKETNKYTGALYSLRDIYENPHWTHKISVEYPVQILVSNASRFHRSWQFRVEKEGREEYSKDGRF